MLKSSKGRKFSFIVLNILNLCCLHVCRKYHLLSRERVQPFIDAEEKVNKVPGVSQIHQAFSTKERWKNSGFKNQTNLKGKASCTRSGLLLQAVPGEGLAKLRAQGLFVNIFCQSVNWNLLPFLQEYVEEPKEIQFSFKEVVKFEKNNVWIVSHQIGCFWGEREQIFNTYCGCWRWRGEVKSIAIYKYSVALLISHDSGVQGYISMFPDTGELLCTEGRGRVHFNQVSFIDLSIPSIKSNHCSQTAIQGWRGDHWFSFEDKRRAWEKARLF